MGAFNGQLRSNEIFAGLFNMIINQQVFADNISGLSSTLVDKARVDGSMFGDTKLYYATDVLASKPWGGDEEATNLLELHRPGDPDVQAIQLDKFRQISLTVDNYLSKRAWSTPDAFGSFISVMKQWITETKRIYDITTYNAFIGTDETSVGKQKLTIKITDPTTEAQTIAQYLADLLIDMSDVTRDYNDYGNLRAYSEDKIKVVWNAKFVNKIKKLDTPTIFHKEGLVDKLGDMVLPARYFGKVQSSSKPSAAGTERILEEHDYNTVKMNKPGYDKKLHIFGGDLVPVGKKLEENEYYTEDPNIICKIYTVLPPYMSAFEVGTSFYNAKSLTENNYLTFGRNTLEHLKNYPCITISAEFAKAVAAAASEKK